MSITQSAKTQIHQIL